MGERAEAAGPAPDLAEVTGRLEANVGVLRALTSGVTDRQARWRPEEGAWSILEVVAHLLDEEREDFRARLRRLLEEPGRAWEPIDPPRWAVERRYRERELAPSFEAFAAERARSVAWLRELEDPPWERAYEHPALGPLRAGDLLAAWQAHDLLHVRQITRLHHQYLTREGGWRTGYAGAW